jgi:simple sugar transport system permease protein
MMVMGRQWNRASVLAVGCAAATALVVGVVVAGRLLAGRVRGRMTRALAAAAGGVGLAVVFALWGASQVHRGFGVLAVLVFVPVVGGVFGAFSGTVIARGRLQPFIVTLAMMISLVGAAKYVAGKGGQIHAIYVLSAEEQGDRAGMEMLHRQLSSEGKGYASESFAALGRGVLRVSSWNERLGRAVAVPIVPIPGIFFVVCVGAAYFVLSRLPFGRYIYAVGGNEETARLSGVNVEAVKTGVYAISGAMAGVAAVLYGAMYGQGKPDAGQMGELDAIAAVVIGGTSLMGGRGGVVGTLVGVLIFGYLSNILVLKGIPSEVQDILKGTIIVAAVLIQERRWTTWTRRLWRAATQRRENRP